MIDDMSDQEKSVMLAEEMGWEIVERKEDQGIVRIVIDALKEFVAYAATEDQWVKGRPVLTFNDLYDPANMALAWRVLNWAQDEYIIGQAVFDWWFERGRELTHAYLIVAPPADAQRHWLDKILTLAIEAGIVDNE